MQNAMGGGHARSDTREGWRNLYEYLARGRDGRRLEAMVGRDGMEKAHVLRPAFGDAFEREFVGQGATRRTVQETLDAGLTLMKKFSLEVA